MDADAQRYIDWIRSGLDKKAGKSQKALAEHLGLAHTQITRLLKGERRLKVDEITKIAEFLGKPPPMVGEDTLLAELVDLYRRSSGDARRMAVEILRLDLKRQEPSPPADEPRD